MLDITEHEGFAIASALRGPDDDNFTIKRLTTAVIRSLAGLTSTTPNILLQSPDEAKGAWQRLSFENKQEVVAYFNDTKNSHFMNHVFDALGYLDLPYLVWLQSLRDTPLVR